MVEPTETTTRGFDSAGTPIPAISGVGFKLPRASDGRPAMQDWEDFSTRVIALNASRGGGALAVADLKEVVNIGDETRWDFIQWDPEAGLVILIPDEDIILSTNPHGDMNEDTEGIPVDADTAFPLHVAGAPQGLIWVRRRASATATNIRAYAYGSSQMVFASRNNYGVSHD